MFTQPLIAHESVFLSELLTVPDRPGKSTQSSLKPLTEGRREAGEERRRKQFNDRERETGGRINLCNV